MEECKEDGRLWTSAMIFTDTKAGSTDPYDGNPTQIYHDLEGMTGRFFFFFPASWLQSSIILWRHTHTAGERALCRLDNGATRLKNQAAASRRHASHLQQRRFPCFMFSFLG